MDKHFYIRKIREANALIRVTEELRVFIDERIRREQEAADALPDNPDDPAWDDQKLLHLENANAYHRIEMSLLKNLIKKQEEAVRLGAVYEYQQKKK